MNSGRPDKETGRGPVMGMGTRKPLVVIERLAKAPRLRPNTEHPQRRRKCFGGCVSSGSGESESGGS